MAIRLGSKRIGGLGLRTAVSRLELRRGSALRRRKAGLAPSIQRITPYRALISPPVSRVKERYETAVVFTGAVAAPVESVLPAPQAVLGLAALLALILRLALTQSQKFTVRMLMAKGVPEGAAIILALTAPWTIENFLQSEEKTVALYRLGRLIGKITAIDWDEFRESMRRNEADKWRAR